MSLEPQTSSEPQGTKKKDESHEPVPKQFDIKPSTQRVFLIAQAIRNVLIIIPVLVLLVMFIYEFIGALVSSPNEFDNFIFSITTIPIIITLPYMVHVILQVVAYMRFRKSVKFQWIRGANIYSLIVAPISEVAYVSFMLGRILSAYSHLSDAENSITMVGAMVALYEVILGISMIVVTTNSIKKTAQLSEETEG